MEKPLIPVTCSQGYPRVQSLDLVLFPVFINDLPSTISSMCKIFADIVVVYREIKTHGDSKMLQEDMKNLTTWEVTWSMKCHPDKCEMVIYPIKRKPLQSTYNVNNHPLHKAKTAKYLGVTMAMDLDLQEHINNCVNKANWSMGFLRRNLKAAPSETREMAYKTMARPQVKYCNNIWDLCTISNTHRVEMVQCRADRFVHRHYHNTSFISAMLGLLG